MKNAIIIASLAILAAGLLLWSRIGPSRSAESAVLATGVTSASFTEQIPAYDFGPISMMKGDVEHEFAIANTTDADLNVTEAETSCMCTEAMIRLPDGKEIGPFSMPGHGGPAPSINVVVRPGEKIAVRAIFNPAAHGPAGIGSIERAVTLATNKGLITMQFRAQVTP